MDDNANSKLRSLLPERPNVGEVVSDVVRTNEAKCARCGEAIRFGHRCIDQ